MNSLPILLVAGLAAVACSAPPEATEPPQGAVAGAHDADPEGGADVDQDRDPVAAHGVTPEAGAETMPQGPRDVERARNLAVHVARGAALAAEAPGQWVLIVGGELYGPWRDFDRAWAATEALAEGAMHAFLYRPGIDDADEEFALSPFTVQNPRWNQIGWRLGRPMRLTMQAAGDIWSRKVDGKVLQAAWGDAGARLQLSDPERSTTVEVRGVRSGLFQQDLTITEDDAEALGLGRFEAPGSARHIGKPEVCRKVLVRLAIEELAIDVPAIAYVLPKSLTGPIWPAPPEWTIDLPR